MKNKPYFITAFVCATLAVGAAAISLLSIQKRDKSFRTLMYFPSFENGKTYTEERFIPKDSAQGTERYFVDDLLLGPLTHSYKKLFPGETTVEFFTVDADGTAYIGLSKGALKSSDDAADINTGISLLKRNIVMNFTKINTVLVYIDGKSVCEKS